MCRGAREPGTIMKRPFRGDVAKWSKAVVCKTTIRRFKSARRLQFLAGWVALSGACNDPPEPPPEVVPAGSPSATAPHVQWQTWADAEAGSRPWVEFHDAPDGPAIAIAADPDVTTFLNDRFASVFFNEPGTPGILFMSASGCVLTHWLRPSTPAAFIEAANAVIVLPETTDPSSIADRPPCPPRR